MNYDHEKAARCQSEGPSAQNPVSLNDAIKTSTKVKFRKCSIEVKVARLHAELVSARQTNNYMARSVEELRGKIHNLYQHNHADGEVVIKIKDTQYPSYGASVDTSLSSFDYLA